MYIDDIGFQLNTFLYLLGWGVFSGILYDVFRLIRVSAAKNKKAIIIFDTAYFVILSVLTFLVMLVVNNGELRLYLMFAMFSGFSVYYITLSRFFISISTFVFIKIYNLLKVISRILTAPFSFIFSLFSIKVKKLLKLLKKVCKIKKN